MGRRRILGLPRFSHFLSALTALILAFVVFLDPKGQSFRAHSKREFHHKKSNSTSLVGEASSAVLLDSITSLIENYYVDEDRVSGNQLVSGAMRTLAFAIPDLVYENLGQTYALSFGGESIEFVKTENMDYDELMGRLKSLIQFCDRIKVTARIQKGESVLLGTEKDSTLIVANAMLSSLDAHSSLMSQEAYEELRQGTEGTFGGLGVLVGIRDHVLTVLKPMPRSPATRMGIQKDDKIVFINGFSTYGLTLDKLVPHMRGEPGSYAELVTLKPGSWAPANVRLTREIIEVDSVESFEHHKNSNHILQLSIDSFTAKTAKQVVQAIKKFKSRYPLTGLILDLRGNPGGLLEQAVLVSDLFLEGGVVVSTKGRRQEIDRATRGKGELDFPLVVLLNEESASASEIVAGALQDNGRAVVIGQPSFGKGSVQTVFELPEQRALKLTIARYFTPADKSIQNVGIYPDIWLQPVSKEAENVNLLGNYRYRGEQFLPNHLNVASDFLKNISSMTRKGFYLADSARNYEEHSKDDPEVQMAIQMFEAVHQIYGDSLPRGAQRSSHWLAISDQMIRTKLGLFSKETSHWLKTQFGVHWQDELDLKEFQPKISLQVKSGARGIKARVGETVAVPWQIINTGAEVAHNISTFIQSPLSGIETKEVLIGTIPGHSQKDGQFSLRIPDTLSPGRYYLTAGVAWRAQAMEQSLGELVLEVEEVQRPEVLLSLSFEDGEKGNLAKILESGEVGKILVTVSNSGDLDAAETKVHLTNLAGQQLSVDTASLDVGLLKAGGKRELSIPIKLKGSPATSALSLGVSLSASNLGGSGVHKTIEIATTKLRNGVQAVQRISH